MGLESFTRSGIGGTDWSIGIRGDGVPPLVPWPPSQTWGGGSGVISILIYHVCLRRRCDELRLLMCSSRLIRAFMMLCEFGGLCLLQPVG